MIYDASSSIASLRRQFRGFSSPFAVATGRRIEVACFSAPQILNFLHAIFRAPHVVHFISCAIHQLPSFVDSLLTGTAKSPRTSPRINMFSESRTLQTYASNAYEYISKSNSGIIHLPRCLHAAALQSTLHISLNLSNEGQPLIRTYRTLPISPPRLIYFLVIPARRLHYQP